VGWGMARLAGGRSRKLGCAAAGRPDHLFFSLFFQKMEIHIWRLKNNRKKCK
jgi:hypothetical protein